MAIVPCPRTDARGPSVPVNGTSETADGNESSTVEYLFGIERCRGSLDCFTAYLDHPATPQKHWAGHILRYRITRKTPKRIYYARREFRGEPRHVGCIDRLAIEATGEIVRRGEYSGAPDSHLYLAPPAMPEWWTPKPATDPDGQTTAATGGA